MIARFVLVLSLLAALPAAAQEDCPSRRHVDCAGALRAVDAAIAADPWLSILDRARAMRLAELLTPLGPEAAAELTRQDAAWRRSLSRNLFFNPDGSLDEPDPRAALRGSLEYWLMRLIQIDPLPAPGITGRWMSARGEVVIRRRDRDHFDVEINAADINNAAWTCEYEGEGRSERIDWLETDDGEMELRWLGTTLQVSMLPVAPVPFCGAAGSPAGVYFRIGDAD